MGKSDSQNRFEDYLGEQLKDPALKVEYDAFDLEFEEIKGKIEREKALSRHRRRDYARDGLSEEICRGTSGRGSRGKKESRERREPRVRFNRLPRRRVGEKEMKWN